MAGVNFGQELVVFRFGNRVAKQSQNAQTNQGVLTVPGTGAATTGLVPRLRQVVYQSIQTPGKPDTSQRRTPPKRIRESQLERARTASLTVTRRRRKSIFPTSFFYPSRRKRVQRYSYVARNR